MSDIIYISVIVLILIVTIFYRDGYVIQKEFKEYWYKEFKHYRKWYFEARNSELNLIKELNKKKRKRNKDD